MTNGLGGFPSQIYEKADITHHPFFPQEGDGRGRRAEEAGHRSANASL